MARGAIKTLPGHPAGAARLRFRSRRDPPRGRKAAGLPPSPVRRAARRRTRDGLLDGASPALTTIVTPSQSGNAVTATGAADGAVAAGLRTARAAAVPGPGIARGGAGRGSPDARQHRGSRRGDAAHGQQPRSASDLLRRTGGRGRGRSWSSRHRPPYAARRAGRGSPDHGFRSGWRSPS